MEAPFLDVATISQLQYQWTMDWHKELPPMIIGQPPMSFVELNHHTNFLQWHAEDLARVDERVLEAKREIERCNRIRVKSIEDLDEWLSENLTQRDAAQLNSETPGMIIDRLSILALRNYHLMEEMEREDIQPLQRDLIRHKAAVVIRQKLDLMICLQQLMKNIALGHRRFNIYKQMKLYDDPATNPELYGKSSVPR